MEPNLYEHFDDKEDAVKYYSNNFLTVDRLNFLKKITGTMIEGSTKPDEIAALYDNGVLEELHEYVADLRGVNKNNFLDGISRLDKEKLKEIEDERKDDKEWLTLYLMKWGWKDNLNLFNALNKYTSRSTVSRKRIDGERSYENIESNLEELEDKMAEATEEMNEYRNYKAKFKRIDVLGDDRLLIRFDVERKSGRYRQFNIRNPEKEDNYETHSRKYRPISVRNFYLDYENDEFDLNMSRKPEDFEEAVLGVFYKEGFEVKGEVEFVAPTDYPELSVEGFISQRVQNLVAEYSSDDSIGEEEFDERKKILSRIEEADQTAIEIHDVPGDWEKVTFEAQRPLIELIEEYDLKDQYEEWSEKSRDVQYELNLEEITVEVSRHELDIKGDVSEQEQEVITDLLKKREDEWEMEP